MYEEFYGLTEKPFALSPDPAFLFLSNKHRYALTLLEYGLESQAGFTVITGHIGSGKTTLARKLLQKIGQEVTVGLVSNSQCESFEELMQWILFSFDLDFAGKSKVELYKIFSDFLIQEYGKNKRTVLIVDEAQHLGRDMLEQLRMLSNINADKHQVLQLILIGQPELWELLHDPALEQFVQRISVDYHLEPLTLEETKEYIRHRLAVAGAQYDIFTEEACDLIWEHTRGVPRLINLLCDTALVYGFGDQKKLLDADLVKDVVKDKSRSVSPLRDRTTGLPPKKREGEMADFAQRQAPSPPTGQQTRPKSQQEKKPASESKPQRRSTIERWNDK